MSTVLVVADHAGGTLRPVSRELVSAAVDLAAASSARVVMAVVASDPDALVPALALEGVDEIAVVATDSEPTSEEYRLASAALIAQYAPEVLLAGFTVEGMDFGPAIAAEHGLGFASDVVGAKLEDGKLVARREIYGAKVVAELELRLPAVLLLRATSWPPAAEGDPPTVTRVELEEAPARVRHREFVEPIRDDVDLAAADAILAIGRGIGDQENVAVYSDLADRLGVALGMSRPLSDMGWLPASRLVGQSGQTVTPKLYLAFGISGATQHLAGMKGASTIVAVNTDPQAPIFGVAHYGAVADVAEVAQELRKLT